MICAFTESPVPIWVKVAPGKADTEAVISDVSVMFLPMVSRAGISKLMAVPLHVLIVPADVSALTRFSGKPARGLYGSKQLMTMRSTSRITDPMSTPLWYCFTS